jgi:hypothetical protein
VKITAHILKRPFWPTDGNTACPGVGDTVLADEDGETAQGLRPGPGIRGTVLKDRIDEARLRTVPTTLSLVEEITEEVRMVSEDGTVASTSFPSIEVVFPKILRAEETGDPVSDL